MREKNEQKKLHSSGDQQKIVFWCGALQVKELNKEREREARGLSWCFTMSCPHAAACFCVGNMTHSKGRKASEESSTTCCQDTEASDQWAHGFWQFHSTKGYEHRLKEFTTGSQRTKKKNAFEESYNSPRACMWICKWKKILAFVGCIELVGVFTAECVCVWRCLDILRVTPQLYSNRFDVFERKINGVILKVIRKKTT